MLMKIHTCFFSCRSFGVRRIQPIRKLDNGACRAEDSGTCRAEDKKLKYV